jgi:hypothetical protein
MRKLLFLFFGVSFFTTIGIKGQTALNLLQIDSLSKINSKNGNLGYTLPSGGDFGAIVTNIGDLDGDGVEDIAASAATDNDGGTHSGAIYILFMNSTATIKKSQKISATEGNLSLSLSSGDLFGMSVAKIGDLDSDGVTELAVGIPGRNSYSGATAILFMKTDGTVRKYSLIDGSSGDMKGILSPSGLFGSSLDGTGDINGDGINDLVVSAPQTSSSGTNKGTIYTLFLKRDGSVSSHTTITEGSGGFTGTLINGALFGVSLKNIGDINGDHVNDIAAGVVADDSSKGAFYILRMKSDGSVKSYTKIGSNTPVLSNVLKSGETFGEAVLNVGDINSDKIDDLVVGATHNSDGGANRGAFYVLYMDTNANVKAYQKFSSSTSQVIDNNVSNNSYFAQSICRLKSTNSDHILLAIGVGGDATGGTLTGGIYLTWLKDTAIKTSIVSKENLSDVFNVFPNPAIDNFNINIGENSEDVYTLLITSLDGRTMLKTKIKKAVISNYNTTALGMKAGLYFVQITSGNSTRVEKLIIK